MDSGIGYIELPCKFTVGDQVKIINTGEICTVSLLKVGIGFSEYRLNGKKECSKKTNLN
nr:MAG TPA: Transcription elongation factor [Caudoviricetes sp.]